MPSGEKMPITINFPTEARRPLMGFHEAMGGGDMAETILILTTLGMALLLDEQDGEECVTILRSCRAAILLNDIVTGLKVRQNAE